MKIEPQIHITPERIEAVKAAHPLADVVPKYATWDKSTRKWLCPIHNEKSGSFNITPDGGGFICYGCGAKGDVIEFIPGHGCTTVNLHEHLYAVRQGRLEEIWSVAARGKVR